MNYNEMYELSREGSLRSARVVVPLLMDLVRPEYVADFGCGHGWWLSEFKRLGCRVRGFDGAHVDRARLMIDPDDFWPIDLASDPVRHAGADLAISLEVAEHLPASASGRFVQRLTDAAPVVAFSAAMPGQGGVHHVNEQWPDYWAARFAERGYRGTGALRWQLWGNPDVEHWYQQIFIYASEAAIAGNERLRALMESPLAPMWMVIHPALWDSRR